MQQVHSQRHTCYLYSHKATSYYSYFNHVYIKNKQIIIAKDTSIEYLTLAIEINKQEYYAVVTV